MQYSRCGVCVFSTVVFHSWWAGGRGAWIDERNKEVKTEKKRRERVS
jgi:hypothetical protein